MSTLESLTPFFLLAVVGSLHCVGMCGGFALAANAGAERAPQRALQLTLYLLGKSLSYAILGVTVSLVAHEAVHVAETPIHIARARELFAWGAGITIILCGVGSMGVKLPSARGPWRSIIKTIEPVWNGVLSLSPLSRSFGIGLSTGLLPCGLSWSALAIATQVSPPIAGLGLFVFGLGTAPALTGVSLARWIAPPRARHLAHYFVGPALILLGLVTLARGGIPIAGAEVLPDCCEAGAPAEPVLPPAQ